MMINAHSQNVRRYVTGQKAKSNVVQIKPDSKNLAKYDPDDYNDFGGLADLPDSIVNEVVDELKARRNTNPLKDYVENPYRPGSYGEIIDGKFQECTPIDEEEIEDDGNSWREETYQWIIPGFLAGGAHPLRYNENDNLDFLRNAGFKAIVSVYESPIDKHYLGDMEYLFIETQEGRAKGLLKICDFIDDMIKNDKPVFVHSLNGLGRAGTVLAAYLTYKDYLTINEAICYVREEYDPGAIETSYQEDALSRIYYLDLPHKGT